MVTTEQRRVVVFELIALRLLLLAMAVVAIATGVLLLSSPLWLPVTIAIWLSAAPMVAIAVLAKPAATRPGHPTLIWRNTR